MDESLQHFFLWIHLLCMAGAFGALLAAECMPTAAWKDGTVEGRVLRLIHALIGIGFLAGLTTYIMRIDLAAAGSDPGRLHMTIGIKFLLLVGVGACTGLASAMVRKGNAGAAGRLRWSAAILLAVAAFLGIHL